MLVYFLFWLSALKPMPKYRYIPLPQFRIYLLVFVHLYIRLFLKTHLLQLGIVRLFGNCSLVLPPDYISPANHIHILLFLRFHHRSALFYHNFRLSKIPFRQFQNPFLCDNVNPPSVYRNTP